MPRQQKAKNLKLWAGSNGIYNIGLDFIEFLKSSKKI